MLLSPSRPERVALHLKSDRLLKADSAIIISNNLKMSCDAIKKHNYIWTISKLPKKLVGNRWTLSKWTPNRRTWLSMCKGTSPLTSCPFTLLFPGPFLSINCPFPNLVPRVFSLSNMAAAGEKTLAHSRNTWLICPPRVEIYSKWRPR